MHGIMKPDWSRDVIHASNNSSKMYKFIVPQLSTYLLEKNLIFKFLLNYY